MPAQPFLSAQRLKIKHPPSSIHIFLVITDFISIIIKWHFQNGLTEIMSLIKKFLIALLSALLIVVVPYLYSRAISPFQAIQSYHLDGHVSQSKDTIRVASYNIAHGRGLATSNWDGGTPDERIKRLDNIAKLIQQINADVIILNEVDFDASWSNHVNQAAYLAKSAGYSYVAEQRNLDFRVLFWTWRFGNAILSKYPIVESQLLNFPNYDRVETLLAGKKRGLVSSVQVGEHPIQIMGIHLSHRSEALRAASAQMIIDQTKGPTVIAGDFNSAPTGFPAFRESEASENAINLLDSSQMFIRKPLSYSLDSDTYTFPSNKPNRVIDWIFASKYFSYLDHQVIKTELSDHRPIIAELALNTIQYQSDN